MPRPPRAAHQRLRRRTLSAGRPRAHRRPLLPPRLPAPAPHPLKFSDIGVAGAWTPANGIGFGVRIYHQPDGTPASVSHAAALEQIPATAVPEPATWTLMLGGVGAVGGALRAQRRRAPRPV